MYREETTREVCRSNKPLRTFNLISRRIGRHCEYVICTMAEKCLFRPSRMRARRSCSFTSSPIVLTAVSAVNYDDLRLLIARAHSGRHHEQRAACAALWMLEALDQPPKARGVSGRH